MGANDHIRMGQQIAALRKARGWSQAQLAEVASLHLRTVQRAEAGRCRAETLMSLASALDADVRDLLPAAGFVAEPPTEYATGSPVSSGPTMLSRLTSGKALLDLVSRGVAWAFDHDPLDREEAEVVAELFQSTHGFAAVYGDLQPAERVRASAVLDERLKAVEAKGLNVLGAVESRPLFLRPGRPVPRPVAVIAVCRRTESGKSPQRAPGRSAP